MSRLMVVGVCVGVVVFALWDRQKKYEKEYGAPAVTEVLSETLLGVPEDQNENLDSTTSDSPLDASNLNVDMPELSDVDKVTLFKTLGKAAFAQMFCGKKNWDGDIKDMLMLEKESDRPALQKVFQSGWDELEAQSKTQKIPCDQL